jgi:hypothetical protein
VRRATEALRAIECDGIIGTVSYRAVLSVIARWERQLTDALLGVLHSRRRTDGDDQAPCAPDRCSAPAHRATGNPEEKAMKWKTSEFEPAPPGLHTAVCALVCDLGTQPNPFDAEKRTRKFFIEFVLPQAGRTAAGKLFSVAQEFSFSTAKKSKLAQLIGMALPENREVDLAELLATAVDLTIVQQIGQKSGQLRAKIMGFSRAKNVDGGVGDLEREPIYFSLEPAEYDPQILAQLPEFLQKKITASPEYAALKRRQASNPPRKSGAVVPVSAVPADDFAEDEEIPL